MIRKQLFLLLSLSIGIMPFLSRMTKSKTNSLKPLSLFDLVGEWTSDDETVLKIENDATVYLNNTPIVLKHKDAQHNQLLLTDHFGYHITITKIADNTLSFHDEVEDASFTFNKANSEKAD